MFIYERPHITMHTLAGGKRGILQTVHLMRDLVDQFKTDPEIRGLALSLVKGCREKDAVGEIECIFHFVRDCIRYVMDVYDVETLHTPPMLLEVGQGDCDDKSTLLATLLESIGYETAFKVTGYHGSDFEHVYVFVRSGPAGIALHLDATEPEAAGWEAPNPTVEMYVQ
jgi:hypothetical protein